MASANVADKPSEPKKAAKSKKKVVETVVDLLAEHGKVTAKDVLEHRGNKDGKGKGAIIHSLSRMEIAGVIGHTKDDDDGDKIYVFDKGITPDNALATYAKNKPSRGTKTNKKKAAKAADAKDTDQEPKKAPVIKKSTKASKKFSKPNKPVNGTHNRLKEQLDPKSLPAGISPFDALVMSALDNDSTGSIYSGLTKIFTGLAEITSALGRVDNS